ncbi:MAG: glycogen-binding domain-containing protein [Candidatus Omnitrophica bacterium]|nr:glycogen-binding domain-containing protein [Candidatus Omnitrophota bacterium]
MARTSSMKPMMFKLKAPQAKRVSLAGSFNNWDIKALSAKKDTRGNWSVKVNLKPGKYEYKFFVDGQWVNDPSCRSCVSNSFGTQNCTVEIK